MSPITGRLRAVRYASMSRMGNPTFDIAVEDLNGYVHILTTATNAGFVYGLPSGIFLYGAQPVLEWHRNKRGKVTHTTRVEE